MKTLTKIAVFYAVVCAVGTVILLAIIPFVRLNVARSELEKAELNIRAGRPELAIARINRVSFWAALYPALSRRAEWNLIRAHARLGEIEKAELLCAEYAQNHARGGRPKQGILERLEAIADPIINSMLSSSAGQFKSPWVGYDALVGELKNAGDLKTLERISKELLVKEPNNMLAGRVQEFLARKQTENDAKATADAVAASNKLAAAQAAALKTTAPSSADHVATARRFLSAKEWDKALEECKLALEADPDNSKAIRLKKLAEARDTKWGYTRTDTRAYDESGKAVAVVPPLVLVEVSGTKDSPSVGTLAVLTTNKQSSSVLVSIKDLELAPGLAANASTEERKVRYKRVLVLKKMDDLRRAVADKDMKSNPNAKRYQDALAVSKVYWTKVKDLTTKRDNAAGDKRMKYADELRQMKGDDIRIGMELDIARKAMEEWRRQHVSDPEASPEMKALQQELSEAQVSIQALISSQ